VFDNPGGGTPDHRSTPAYERACASLRAALEQMS